MLVGPILHALIFAVLTYTVRTCGERTSRERIFGELVSTALIFAELSLLVQTSSVLF